MGESGPSEEAIALFTNVFGYAPDPEALHAGECWQAERIDAALRRAKAEVSLVWTEEPPETPGKYWWRLHSDYEPEIMSVLAYADGTAMRPCDYGHWAGPIALPLDARAAQIEEGE